jgi:heat shock protein HtpX
MYKQIDTNKRQAFFLFFIFVVIIIGLGWVFSYVYNSQIILVIAVVIAVIQSWVAYYFSDSISLAVASAVEAPEKDFQNLHHIVENIAITAGLPKPKIYIIPDNAPNAFATGRDPKHAAIAVTTGLLQTLEKRQLEGVLAHEMSHVGNHDTLIMTMAVTLVGIIVLASDLFMRSLWFRDRDSRDNGNGIFVLIGILLAILAPIFAKLIELAVSRKREYQADATGALITRFPEGLAEALEKIKGYDQPMRNANRATAHLYINEPFGREKKQSWLTTAFSTHPPIDDRIKRLRAMA